MLKANSQTISSKNLFPLSFSIETDTFLNIIHKLYSELKIYRYFSNFKQI